MCEQCEFERWLRKIEPDIVAAYLQIKNQLREDLEMLAAIDGAVCQSCGNYYHLTMLWNGVCSACHAKRL